MPGATSGQAVEPNMFMAQPTLPYSPFAPVEGSWTPTAFDPCLMTAFGLNGANMMSGQALANTPGGFYFPGTTADLTARIWGQENSVAAANSLMLNSFMMNPLSMEQQQQMAGSEVVAMDPMIRLGQGFTGMALNSTPMANMVPVNAVSRGGGGGNVGLEGVQTGTDVPSTATGMSGVIDNLTLAPAATSVVPTPVQASPPQLEKPKSWAAIASQPAKPRPPPAPKPQPPPEVTVESSVVYKKSGGGRGVNGNASNQSSRRTDGHASGGSAHGKGTSSGFRGRTQQGSASSGEGGSGNKTSSKTANQSELVWKLKSENRYNPSELSINTLNARFFVIKSYAEDDIHRSIKHNIWTSTDHGNRRLDQAFRDQKGKGGIFLFFSVNGSGHFCGVAEMVSEVEFNTVTGVWAQDKWKGRFEVKWIYVKDVANNQLRHIRLENNENKPVTNSRDTQEVPLAKARQVIKVVHSYQHTTSIFDDFDHYEKKQEEESKVSQSDCVIREYLSLELFSLRCNYYCAISFFFLPPPYLSFLFLSLCRTYLCRTCLCRQHSFCLGHI